jgi:hypothetical protein
MSRIFATLSVSNPYICLQFNRRYPAPPANVYWGQMVNEGTGLCVDTVGQGVGGGPIGLSTCQYVQFLDGILELLNIRNDEYFTEPWVDFTLYLIYRTIALLLLLY